MLEGYRGRCGGDSAGKCGACGPALAVWLIIVKDEKFHGWRGGPVVELVYICAAFFDRNYGEDRSEEWREAEH